MSLRQDLFDALGDTGRLSRVAGGSVSDAAFCSRLLRDVGAHWVPEMQEWQSLLGVLTQYGWRSSSLAPASFWYDAEGRCGFVRQLTPDKTRFRSVALNDLGRGPLRSRNDLQFLSAPG